jgi:hypothetical protein
MKQRHAASAQIRWRLADLLRWHAWHWKNKKQANQGNAVRASNPA